MTLPPEAPPVDLALVLAAGEGRRMGTPKALVPWEGRPLALVHAEAARAAGCTAVRVVVRADVARALPQPPPGVTWQVSQRPASEGPAGSLVAALADRPPAAWVAVSPVDLPPDAWRCLPALVAALARGADAAKPVHAGRGGHPVVVRMAVLEGYTRGSYEPLRAVLRALGDRVVSVPVDEPAVLGDLDTPEALRDAADGKGLAYTPADVDAPPDPLRRAGPTRLP